MNEQALKERLKAIAKEKEIHFNQCWKQLLLERFLARLSCSSLSDKFIFKGGFLLSYLLDIGRETTDLDFLLTKMETTEEAIENAFERIAVTSSEDGFIFAYKNLSPLVQPHMNYPGFRATLMAQFGKMRDKIHIDVGVGDIVKPKPLYVQLVRYRGKPIFEHEISLKVYPVETIFAEKLETIISKGSGNSRMKDYHDLYRLVKERKLNDSNSLQVSLSETFYNRGTDMKAISFDEKGMEKLQKLWQLHLRGLGDVSKKLAMPNDIREVIEAINSFLNQEKH